MKAWELNAPQELVAITKDAVAITDVNTVKVKIELLAVSSTDKAIFDAENYKYPLILGRHGVGVVSQTANDDCFLQKGDKVIIDPYLPCEKCSACIAKDKDNCEKMDILGYSTNGLFRDFVNLPIESVHKIPNTISFENAIFAEYIALAVNIVSKISIKKGDYVAIISNSKLGLFLAQMVSYYQGIPILIDSNDEMLENANASGVEYTLNPLQSKVTDEVFQITNGRMCEKAIFHNANNLNSNLAVDLCGYKASLCVCGINRSNLSIDLKAVCNKQLTIYTEYHGYGSMPTAINLLAKKAVLTDGLVLDQINFDYLGEYMKTADKNKLLYKNTFVRFD